MTSQAVVLGGGGVTGMAWEVGVIAGLAEAGVDLTTTDAVFGTSAGSFVGSALASRADWRSLYARYAEGNLNEPLIATSPAVWAGWQAAFRDGGGDYAAIGRGFGKVAREMGSSVDDTVRLAVVKSRLVGTAWPETLRVTAVNGDTGELAVFDRTTGIGLVDAVSASGAVPGIWPAVIWNDHTWIDGGMVSAANATLAQGFDQIVVLAPMPAGYAGIPSAKDDVEALNRTASAILVSPDDTSITAIGQNPYDAARSPEATRAGYEQGLAVAAEVRAIWVPARS
jgi:NTE family protein